MSLSRAGSAVRDGIVNSLTTRTRIEGEIVVLVRTAISSTVGAAGTVTDELVVMVRDAVAGAVQLTQRVGTGFVASAKSVPALSVARMKSFYDGTPFYKLAKAHVYD